ncbi:MAG: site-specific integrase [Chloroflexi bacterium]|nr:MAG: site-specific integrase [Chloroflexota bacterium]
MPKRKRSVHGGGSVYQRKGDGRWVAKFKVEATGKWRELYARTEKEAYAKLQQALFEQKQGTLVTAPQQSLQAHMEHWLQVKRLELKDGTYTYYRVYTEAYILPVLGHIRLQKLTDAHIQSFYADLLEDVSANTVRLIHGILRTALEAAVRWKKIPLNPCKTVTPPRAVKKELTYLTLEQAQRLLEGARNHKLECLLTLALATGMRQGELLALRWTDIDFQKATLHVTRSLSYRNPDGTGYEHKVEEPKTASSKRTIPLPDFALEALQKHRVQQLERRLKTPEWEDKGLVFPNDTGGYLWVDPLRRQLKKLLQEAGLPVIRFHDLRHSAATILLAMGVNAKVIQERLGHSHISITLGVYGHVTESMQLEAITKLDDQFKRSKGGQP